ncbi:MAG: penicillin-binding protein activator [Gammaproteobacteria bacterium]|nr:penicillin-binding protein activator [Gammaproteobacteria bacterium]MCP5137250.1 penicillin-binding protein activator [Gammaproteobacteria bacterium]
MSPKRISKLPIPHSVLIRTLAVSVMLLTLTACGPGGVTRPEADDKAIAAATQMSSLGRYLDAANAFLALAAKENAPFRQQFEMDAVEQLLQAPDLSRAAQILSSVDLSKSDDGLRSRHQLLGARLALALSDPARALLLLQPKYPQAAVADQVLRSQLRVIAHKQLGQGIEAIRERLQLASLLSNATQYAQNVSDIWAAFGQLDDITVATLAQQFNEPDLQAWAELALVDRESRFDYLQFQARANDWRVRHPNHAAAGGFLDGLIEKYSAPLEAPSQIALILPLNGRYAAQAAAVRDGFMAAHFDRQSQTGIPTTIRVYDSGDGQIKITELYARAVADGAKVIVGPLAKPAVEQLAAIADLQIPVLALNRIDVTAASTKFYQFGLPPEDEADAIVQRAVSSGLTQALVITTEGAWGDRVGQSFQSALTANGGLALAVARLPATSSDYRNVLEDALLLKQSLARRNDVMARIGTSAEFEPRRRDDVQVILVASNDRQMRSLRPQLEFHHAEDLPIIALSNIYSGYPDANADRDLNGVMFADSPWRIDDATSAPSERLLVDRFWPERNAQAGNLFALGVDAYRLLPYVPRLANTGGTRIEGASGGLFVDSQRQVHRQPVFAVFKNGVPIPAPDLVPPTAIGAESPQL